MLRRPGLWRRTGIAIGVVTSLYLLAILVFKLDDVQLACFGERRYVDAFFLLGVGGGPALLLLRGPVPRLGAVLLIAASVVIASLGTVSPWLPPDAPGIASELAEFGRLQVRAPLAASFDLAALAAAVLCIGAAIWRTAGVSSPPSEAG